MNDRLHRLLHRMAVWCRIDRLVERYHRHAHGHPDAAAAPDAGSQALYRIRRSPYYPLLVGALAFISAATGLYPFGPVIVAATVFAPPRWRGIYAASVLGAALGGMVSATVIQHAGVGFVDRFFPGIREHELWAQVTYWIDLHGGLSLAAIAALPVPQTPVLVVSALAGLHPATIALALFAGKLVKDGIYILGAMAVLRVIHSVAAGDERKG